MKYRRQLLNHPDIYDLPGSDKAFLFAMREITAHHIAHCPQYANIVKQQGFKLKSLQSLQDLHQIPPLPTLFLKQHKLLSVPENQMIIKATSSGTSGHKSTVGIDLNTGLFALEMVLRSFLRLGLISPVPTNYIVLGYQPSKHNKAGIAKTAFGFTLMAPALHREYALKDTGSTYKLNIDGLVQALIKYEKQALPVRLMGLPAYHYLLLTTLKEKKIKLKLCRSSYLCMGGGWKQFNFEHADRAQLYRLAQEVLGIPKSHCIDFYGAVEHPVLYSACKNNHFHVPVYSRAIVRDVNTLQPVPFGTPGILNLLSPLVRSMPLHSIVTDDLAVLQHKNPCTCGNPAPYFKLLGRAGLKDVKTCATNAAQFLPDAAKQGGGL